MASIKQNKDFISDLLPYLLDEAVDWIKSNMSPEDVFNGSQLNEWAEENGFVVSSE